AWSSRFSLSTTQGPNGHSENIDLRDSWKPWAPERSCKQVASPNSRFRFPIEYGVGRNGNRESVRDPDPPLRSDNDRSGRFCPYDATGTQPARMFGPDRAVSSTRRLDPLPSG